MSNADQNGRRDEVATEGPVSPTVEVTPQRPRRRTYTAEYKLRILQTTDDLPRGELYAFLRREGLYWSHLRDWRKQLEDGILAGLEPKRRGPLPSQDPEAGRELLRLKRENERLQRDLERAKQVIDVQKKLCELFGLPAETESP